MEDVRRTEGLAILRAGASVIEEYLLTGSAIQNRALIDQLWAALAPHDPRSYRGIGCMLQGVSPTPQRWEESDWFATMHVNPSDPLLEVIRELGRFTEEDRDRDDGDLLFDLDQARQVLSFAPTAGPRLDVVTVRREKFANSPSVLGFDVGYWGGDHFSLICDSMVTPTWHPPHPQDFEKLATAAAGLNEHFLFRSADAAAEFCARYKQFPWAETEGYPGEFTVIQIEVMSVPK
jgi:hypothetical protein